MREGGAGRQRCRSGARGDGACGHAVRARAGGGEWDEMLEFGPFYLAKSLGLWGIRVEKGGGGGPAGENWDFGLLGCVGLYAGLQFCIYFGFLGFNTTFLNFPK